MSAGTLPATVANGHAVPAEAEVESGVGFMSERSFSLIQRAARLLSESTLVPKEFQKHIPNCVIALNMAQRIGADPLMTMQNLYVVHGRPGWSAQFLIATFNQCGRFSAIRYEWSGTKGTGKAPNEDWGCRAWAIERDTGDKIVGAAITIRLAKDEGWYSKNGSKWQSMPEQMLMYRAAAWLVRAYAPEIAMGLHTADEIEDSTDGGDFVDEPKTTTRKRAKVSALNDPPAPEEPEPPSQQTFDASGLPSNEGEPQQTTMLKD